MNILQQKNKKVNLRRRTTEKSLQTISSIECHKTFKNSRNDPMFMVDSINSISLFTKSRREKKSINGKENHEDDVNKIEKFLFARCKRKERERIKLTMKKIFSFLPFVRKPFFYFIH